MFTGSASNSTTESSRRWGDVKSAAVAARSRVHAVKRHLESRVSPDSTDEATPHATGLTFPQNRSSDPSAALERTVSRNSGPALASLRRIEIMFGSHS